MKLNGYEVFSRQTTGSWRLLVTAASIIITVECFGYNNKDWTLVERSIAPDDFDKISTAVLIFLTVSYLVNWYGDYVGLTKWFKRDKVVKNEWGGSSSADNMESPLEGVKRRLLYLQKSNENASDRVLELGEITIDVIQSAQGDRNVAQDLSDLREITKQNSTVMADIRIHLKDLKVLLENMGPNYEQASLISRVLLFGWYLILPVSLAVVALVLLHQTATLPLSTP